MSKAQLDPAGKEKFVLTDKNDQEEPTTEVGTACWPDESAPYVLSTDTGEWLEINEPRNGFELYSLYKAMVESTKFGEAFGGSYRVQLGRNSATIVGRHTSLLITSKGAFDSMLRQIESMRPAFWETGDANEISWLGCPST